MTTEDFQGMVTGDLNPMMAFMGGKIKIDGDMSVAMQLQSLFS
jgi:putative sterol carrier protein